MRHHQNQRRIGRRGELGGGLGQDARGVSDGDAVPGRSGDVDVVVADGVVGVGDSAGLLEGAEELVAPVLFLLLLLKKVSNFFQREKG